MDIFKSEELKERARRVVDELREMVETVRSDSTLEQLSESTRKLLHDLTLDPQTGKPSIWALRDSLDSLRPLLVPVLLKELDIVPIAEVKGVTETYDYALRHIVFTARDLLPERLRLNMDFDLDVRFKEKKIMRGGKGTEAGFKGELILRLDKLRPCLHDVQFHYRRTAFPRIEDWGWADVDFGQGDGMNFEIRWNISVPRDGFVAFKSARVDCYVDSLDVTIKQAAQHQFLDTLVARMFAGSLKDRIEREIEKALNQFSIKLSDSFNDIFAGRIAFPMPISMGTL